MLPSRAAILPYCPCMGGWEQALPLSVLWRHWKALPEGVALVAHSGSVATSRSVDVQSGLAHNKTQPFQF